MAEEKPAKKIENIAEKKEEKEFLARSEIKTMGKDISSLREGQAQQEREKISKIKTEEEIQKEKERQEKAQKAARERELAEREAQGKREEFQRLKEEREKKTEVMGKEQIKKEERGAEGFKELLKETQAKEEEERRRFLERVEAKAEEKEEISAPLPPIAPPLPPSPEKAPEIPKKPSPLAVLKKIPKPAFKKPSFQRPSFGQKLWIRIVLTLLVLAIIGAIATFWYWYFAVKEKPAPAPPVTEQETEEVEKLIIPPALISTENSQTLELSSLGQILQAGLGESQFTRLVIKDAAENKALGLREFFEAFEVKTPETFYNKVGNDFTLFVYSSQGTNRLGFVAEIKEADLLYLLKYWEATMEQDFEVLSVFLGKTGPSLVSYFREAAYKNTVFRYLSFPPQNFGICWAMVDNYFIFTFSGESIIKTIDKIESKR